MESENEFTPEERQVLRELVKNMQAGSRVSKLLTGIVLWVGSIAIAVVSMWQFVEHVLKWRIG